MDRGTFRHLGNIQPCWQVRSNLALRGCRQRAEAEAAEAKVAEGEGRRTTTRKKFARGKIRHLFERRKFPAEIFPVQSPPPPVVAGMERMAVATVVGPKGCRKVRLVTQLGVFS